MKKQFYFNHTSHLNISKENSSERKRSLRRKKEGIRQEK